MLLLIYYRRLILNLICSIFYEHVLSTSLLCAKLCLQHFMCVVPKTRSGTNAKKSIIIHVIIAMNGKIAIAVLRILLIENETE